MEKDIKNLDEILLKERISHVSPIQSFSEDLKRVSSMENNSAASIMIRESREKEILLARKKITNPRNLFLFLSAFILILFSLFLLYRYYFLEKTAFYQNKNKNSSNKKEFLSTEKDTSRSFFITESSYSLKKTIPSEILAELKEVRSLPFESRSTKQITLENTSTCSVKSLERITSSNIPLKIKSSFKELCLLGLYSDDSAASFFLITEINAPEDSISILEWEDTLARTILPLFGKDRFSSDKTDLFNQKLTSDVFKNKDMRVLKNNSRDIIFYYGLVLNKYIIFTEKYSAFDILEKRLRK